MQDQIKTQRARSADARPTQDAGTNVAERILVGVDGSAASERAVAYVARLAGRDPACHVHLFNVVEPVEPTWNAMRGDLETDPGAVSDPAEARLIEEAKKRTRPVLERMTEVLRRAGVPSERIEGSWVTAAREDSFSYEILQLARTRGFGTVVVGRSALPWYRELFHPHLGEQLVHKGEGLTVWIVE